MAKPAGLNTEWASSGSITDPGSTKEETGWIAEIPTYQNLNFILNKHSAALSNLNSWGILEWDALTVYTKGAKVMYSGVTYTLVATTDTGTTPGTDSSIWENRDTCYYDYIIYSDETLQALCDGTVSGATSVFVTSGTWTASEGSSWALDATDTKRVVGGSGAKLKFSETASIQGIFHESTLDQSNPVEYNITNLEVEITGTLVVGLGFSYCDHLTNCKVTGLGLGTKSVRGFSNCDYLTNCTGTSGSGYGFYNCDHLTNCTGSGESTSGNAGYGFFGCDHLTNCMGTGLSASGSAYGFNSCKYLTNCIGTGTGTSDVGLGYGFYSCDYLTNCTGTGSGISGSAYGFSRCDYLTNCTGSGESTSGNAYGFSTCEYVYAPTSSSSGSTATFNNTNGVQTNTLLS